jgi:hypothetical protein
MLKGNGTGISAATAGTDYQAPITLTTTGSSGVATLSNNTLNIPNYTVAGLGAVAGNSAITGATKTKITYDSKGLVTAGADATTADIASSTNKRYVNDAQLTVIENTSNTNSGDETANGIRTKLGITTLSGSNTGDQTITLTGDVTGSGTGSFATTIGAGKITSSMLATSAVNLTTDKVTGTLPVTKGGTGAATLTGYVKGNGTSVMTASASIPQADVTNLTTDLGLKASLASPALTGTPTAPTATQGANTQQIATTEFVTRAVSNVSPTSFSGSLNGDVTGTQSATVVGKINGTSLATLATGILKNTTSTGVPSIAVADDFPTLNQSTTGSAATLTTARSIYGNNFDGSAALTGIIASTFGGTGNGFTEFTGPATSKKTFTLPNESATILTTNAAVTVAQGGTGTTTAPTAGGVIYATSTSAYASSSAGTAGQVLISKGSSAPVWATQQSETIEVTPNNGSNTYTSRANRNGGNYDYTYSFTLASTPISGTVMQVFRYNNNASNGGDIQGYKLKPSAYTLSNSNKTISFTETNLSSANDYTIEVIYYK